MNLSETELCMLEQLTYLDENVAEKANIKGFFGIKGMHSGMTVEDILDIFGEKELEALENVTDAIDGAKASGAEWARIIRYLKNSKLKNLQLTNVMKGEDDGPSLALCFVDSASPGEAIVAFKGTTGPQEWKENVEGLNVADTKAQKDALYFIESLPYNNITVTGHSKGGNKAMYVAITSDKVTKCVSFDGQGFSREFIDKYWAEIQLRGGNISNLSLSTDFVHVLLYPVPGSNQHYFQGYGVDSPEENHSPNSFFNYDEDGEPGFTPTDESPSMKMIHNFTTFVLNNASGGDKHAIVNYLAPLVAMIFSDPPASDKEKLEYIFSDPDTLALIAAYLAKYVNEYGLSSEDVNHLLESLGLDPLSDFMNGVIDYVIKQANDGDSDFITKYIFAPIAKWKYLGEYDVNATELWEKINEKVGEIDVSSGCGDAAARTEVLRDFSKNTYDMMMNAALKIDNMGSFSLAAWNGYMEEEWYDSLYVDLYKNAMAGYVSHMIKVNQTCKTRIDEVFNNISTIDTARAQKLNEAREDLFHMREKIIEQADKMKV